MKKFIYSMFLVLAASLVACTEDFSDWKQPQQVDQPAVVTFGDGSVSSVALIDFANIPAGQALVKVCNLTAPTASDEAFSTQLYRLHLSYLDEEAGVAEKLAESELTTNGEVPTDFIKSVVEQKFGKAPKENKLIGVVEQWISNGETTVKTATSGEFEIKVQLDAPLIETGYYLIGDFNEWNGEALIAFKHSDNNVYDDPYFTVSFETTADGQYWKIIPQSNVDAGNVWADGVLGPEIDGDSSFEGMLVSTNPGAGMIETAGKYKMTINMMDYTYTIDEVKYDEFIYFIGATDGWTNAEQKLTLTDGDNGVYTGFIYCADPNGWGNQFKFQRVAGDWGTELNSGHFTSFVGDVEDCGGNIGVTGGENVYFFSVNLSAGEISATEVLTMGIVGGFNGWGAPDIAMTWNPTAYCYEANIADVTGEWKFRVNEDWAINLGGSLNDLVANGGNLNVTGTTVQLYPTRKSGETIFATIDGEVAEEPEPNVDPSELTPFIYFIGATDGWGNAEQKLALTDSDNGVYTGFIYCADPNGWGNQFKFQQVAGDWGTELNAGHFTSYVGDVEDCDGNIGVTGGECVYYFSVNLSAGEIYAEEVKTMGIIGDFNGWGGDLEMTWNVEEYCFEAAISDVTASGWKFRLNGGWDINLGGDVDNLTQNGTNLSATGLTCKLYPTRKTNDNIYCVVE